MDYKYMLLEKEDGIAVVTLNRPEKLNALFPPMRVEMREILEALEKDDSVRVVILTGAGRGFCSGADVGTFAIEPGDRVTEDEPRRRFLLQPLYTARIRLAIENLNKPTICALNGWAVGAGVGFALTCDIIIASELAKCRVGFLRVGLPAGDGLSYLLPRRIGTHRALELIYTDDVIDAQEMERIGLVNKVVPHGELMKTAKEMAKKMFQLPPISLALAKQSIYHSIANPNKPEHELFDSLVGRTLEQTEDTREAQLSYIQKRAPVYKGK